jgi:uncharacterized membrane protein
MDSNSSDEHNKTSLRYYIFSKKVGWFHLIIFYLLITSLSIFTISANQIPFVYVRYLLGTILLIFLPGYCIVKILYPGENINNINTLILSVAISISIVPLVGLLLNHSPWGISFISVAISQILFNLILVFIALIVDYYNKYEDIV